MSNLSKLHIQTREMHQVTERHDFLIRYKDKVTALDHYRHLCQLQPIYEALEIHLKQDSFIPKLPEDLSELLMRSEKIKADISALEPHIPKQYRNPVILAATLDYVKALQNMQLNAEIFAHFLVRILGDLFGGQAIKRYVRSMQARENIVFKNENDPVNFYLFSDKMLTRFSKWFEDYFLTDDVIGFAKQAFEKHIAIFNELESTRIKQPVYTSYSFLNNLSKEKVAVALVSAGVMAAGLYFSSR